MEHKLSALLVWKGIVCIIKEMYVNHGQKLAHMIKFWALGMYLKQLRLVK